MQIAGTGVLHMKYTRDSVRILIKLHFEFRGEKKNQLNTFKGK